MGDSFNVSDADRRRTENDIRNLESVISGWKDDLRSLERQEKTRETERQMDAIKDRIRGKENEIRGLKSYLK